MGFWEEKGKPLVCAAALLLASAGAAVADENHYNSTIIGERPAGMAGAYTAVSDDASGLYYNPAGIVYSQGNNLSASVNAYSTYEKTYDNAIGSNKYVRRSASLNPNYFGVIQHTPFGTIGFSYAMPESIMEEQNSTMYSPLSNVSSWTINYNTEVSTYDFGFSYANSVSRELSLGATLYFEYRKNKTIANYFTLLTNGTTQELFKYKRDDEWSIHPTIGVMWSSSNAPIAVGFTISKNLPISRSEDSLQITKAVSGTYATNPQFLTATTDNILEYPLNMKFGIAYFPTNALLIDWDVSYYSSVNGYDPIYGVSLDKTSVVNTALGIEYYTSSSFAVRTGFYTDLSNRSSGFDNDKINLYGVALSGTYFNKSTSITMGFNYSFGQGGRNINADVPTIQDMKMYTLAIFLGTSYSY